MESVPYADHFQSRAQIKNSIFPTLYTYVVKFKANKKLHFPTILNNSDVYGRMVFVFG